MSGAFESDGARVSRRRPNPGALILAVVLTMSALAIAGCKSESAGCPDGTQLVEGECVADASGEACGVGRYTVGDDCLARVIASDVESAVIDPDTGVPFIPTQLVLYASSTATSEEIIEAAAGVDAEVGSYDAVAKRYVLVFSGPRDTVEMTAAKEQLEALEAVLATSRNWVSAPTVTTPDDSGWGGDPWTEDTPEGSNWPLEMIRAPSAWDYGTSGPSDGMRVGVIDWGIPNHTDLVGVLTESCLLASPNCASAEPDPVGQGASVGESHGRWVTGVLAAAGSNGDGLTGVVWDSEVAYCQTDGSTTRTAECFRWLLDGGARVINFSGGRSFRTDCDPGPRWECPYVTGLAPSLNAFVLAQRQESVLSWTQEMAPYIDDEWVFVQSAGNDALADASLAAPVVMVESPLADRILVAGAVTRSEEPSPFSNLGDVSIVAPGGDGTDVMEETILVLGSDGQLESVNGTSFSAPLVSGVVALAWSRYPELDAVSVRAAVVAGTRTTADGSSLLDALGAVEEIKAACEEDGGQLDKTAGRCEGLTEVPTRGGGGGGGGTGDATGAGSEPTVCNAPNDAWNTLSSGDMAALEGCNIIVGHLNLADSPVSSLEVFASLESLEGNLILGDTQLQTLHGLDNLKQIEGSVDMWYNDSLVSLDGLQQLESIGGWLDINSNPLLESLEGLSALEHVGTTIEIVYNDSLSECEAQAFADSIASALSASVEGNGPCDE